jgi:hypothetical protein
LKGDGVALRAVIARSAATKQPSSYCVASGLLDGACHRAALAPTRWLAMTRFANSSPRYRGNQEEVTMLEFFIFAAGFAGDYTIKGVL